MLNRYGNLYRKPGHAGKNSNGATDNRIPDTVDSPVCFTVLRIIAFFVTLKALVVTLFKASKLLVVTLLKASKLLVVTLFKASKLLVVTLLMSNKLLLDIHELLFGPNMSLLQGSKDTIHL